MHVRTELTLRDLVVAQFVSLPYLLLNWLVLCVYWIGVASLLHPSSASGLADVVAWILVTTLLTTAGFAVTVAVGVVAMLPYFAWWPAPPAPG